MTDAAEVTPLGAPGTFSIGELINGLKDEFPELTVSKIRFLEGQGLVEPDRSPAGYRVFRDDDVRRIKYILRAQRDHFLPLKVIKSKLTAWERGEEPAVSSSTGPPPDAYFATSGVTMTAEDLSRSSGLTTKLIDELVDAGILAPEQGSDGKLVFGDEELVAARAAQRLISHGLEPRHLRTLRLAADREADLVHQLVSPMLRHRSPENRRKAAEILADCAQAGTQMKEALVRRKFSGMLEG